MVVGTGMVAAEQEQIDLDLDLHRDISQWALKRTLQSYMTYDIPWTWFWSMIGVAGVKGLPNTGVGSALTFSGPRGA